MHLNVTYTSYNLITPRCCCCCVNFNINNKSNPVAVVVVDEEDDDDDSLVWREECGTRSERRGCKMK